MRRTAAVNLVRRARPGCRLKLRTVAERDNTISLQTLQARARPVTLFRLPQGGRFDVTVPLPLRWGAYRSEKGAGVEKALAFDGVFSRGGMRAASRCCERRE